MNKSLPKTFTSISINNSVYSINKYQTFIIGAAVFTGLIVGHVDIVQKYSGYFIVPFLIVMLFGLFLNIPVQYLLKSYTNHKFFFANIGINFIWTPVLAYLLGSALLGDEPDLRIGFLMLMVTPCTDWYLVFTGSAKGNTALSASFLPLNLML